MPTDSDPPIACVASIVMSVPFVHRSPLVVSPVGPSTPLPLPSLLSVVLLVFLLVLFPPSSGAVKASSEVRFEIKEELRIGAVVGELASSLTAIGKETAFGGSDHYFNVSSSGTIKVRNRVDREDPVLCSQRAHAPCKHNFVVFAGKSMAVISVKVTIDDVNDNEPKWDREPLLEVPENWRLGNFIDLPLAKDADSGANGIVSYELASRSPYFDLKLQHNSQGAVIPRLQVSRGLDREAIAWHNLTLLAKDGTPPFFTGTAIVRIRVVDQNDNAPAFSQDLYEAWVEEDVTRGHMVTRVVARDPDEGENARLRYSWDLGTPDFVKSALDIDPREGVITVAGQLNYEVRKSYEFYVVATDNGNPSKSARAKVKIRLRDTNNNKPQIKVQPFPRSMTRVEVEENKANGTNIATVFVTDNDSGNNGDVSCSLSPARDFMLEFLGRKNFRSIFRVYTRQSFDREKGSLRQAKLICRDHGEHSQSSEYHLVVHITDVNDNPPKFVPGNFYDRPVPEDNQPNDQIAAVSATDADDGPNKELTFIIRWPKEAGECPFRINRDGAIIATQSLDREKNPNGFTFNVVAKDNGKPSLSATATVSISLFDINDNPPVFSQKVYTFQVKETPQNSMSDGYSVRGDTVGIVNASDADAMHNGQIVYSLKPSGPFVIDRNGRIMISRAVDRETMAQYKMRVIAVDQALDANRRLTATADVIIHVMDINDNAPQFRYPNASNNRLHLSYREKPTFRVARIRAVDRDDGQNAKLHYSITKGNIYSLFHLDSETGDLVLQNDMSAAHMGTIVLRLKATDEGVPPLSAWSDLELVIDDSAPLGGRLSSTQGAGGEGDWEANRLIIICIVLGTGVMCAVLATAICLIARRSPCPSTELHHSGKFLSPFRVTSVVPLGRFKGTESLIRFFTDGEGHTLGDTLSHTSVRPCHCKGLT